ncbi:P-loop containing nucleoside triphosphate hydrolase protein [Crucibulum laeve]|uniref:ATP-dependent RNA helicase n=1 Tax=Crucibulum laeve TaxID=68775 RepID=A0A5C3M680_9AGAR|nr:P-loop containing nucleoside triphosphate hydrolase protein [Crucibulum laeve]
MTTELAKEKTKAKQRYLKRKKERRKHRPKTTQDDSAVVEDTLGSTTKKDIEVTLDITYSTGRSSPDRSVDGLQQYASGGEERPKKRPRLVPSQEVEVMMDSAEVLPAAKNMIIASSTETALPVALPSFPLPAVPDAPSKSVLALQGLDQALVEADIVHPTTSVSVPQSENDDGGTKLCARTRRRLNDLGITELFAVQTTLLPFLLPQEAPYRALYTPYNPPRDACISAPTGSGKTLAYVLPIIEILSQRLVTRLRALVVLPTRDLVVQVRETFEALGKGHGLKIGTATGQHSFAHEQSQLVFDKSTDLHSGSSKVDILICTPGRLIDHLNGTPNFSLQHLRFLVIDEADRLLAQSFQDWLAQVLSATRPSLLTGCTEGTPANSLPFHDAISPAFMGGLTSTDIPTFFTETPRSSCQKLLFSATLTRDPGKIAALNLRNPKYFIVQGTKDGVSDSHVLDVVMEKFTMPETLTEHMLVCEASQKPLIFFHLVYNHQVKNALVFTKSAESTTRLVRLFDFFQKAWSTKTMAGLSQPIVIRAYSSDLPANERKNILERFKAQEIQVLVCSDLISRGIDISHVNHVVSYDVPVDMRKYVHRVGRTARAGRDGDAWTLVEEQEARYFKSMLKEADHLGKVKRVRVSEKDVELLLAHYETALGELKEVYTRQG